jgi:cytochrome P450
MAKSPSSATDHIASVLGAWAFRNMDGLFAVARTLCPILVVTYQGKRYALVVRYDDVQEVLLRPNIFNVVYAPKLRVILDGDNIFLGMRDEPQATRDKTLMRVTAPRAEAETRVKPEVERLATEIVERAPGRIDVVMQLTQEVTTRFFGDYFGTPGPSVDVFSDWARLLFKYMFVDRTDDPALRAKVEPVAAQLRAYVETAIAKRKQQRGVKDDILERCLQFQDLGVPGTTDREIRNNLIGLIVGALPQAPMLIPQLLDVLLNRPAELAAASQAARSSDDALLAKYVFEASRYYPLTPGLFRDCTEDYTVAGGTWRARTIRSGTTVVAATRSAMFDGRRIKQPKKFRLDRPDYNYFHFGYGMHECFGLYMNRTMIPAICKTILKKRNLRRAVGESGQLQMDGAFAKSLVVEFDG